MAQDEQLDLSKLAPNAGSRKRRKRIGFGEGSGNGKTCGKGQKGQRARCGFSLPRGFEGGQMPLYRRLPKIGFTSRKKVSGENVFGVISLAKLEELNVTECSLEVLRDNGLVRGRTGKVKILGKGPFSKKISVEVHAASASAKAAIEAAGGTVRIIS